MRILAVAAVLACMLSLGCTSSSEKVEIIDADISHSGVTTYSYTGHVNGRNSGEATYKMCAVQLRGGEKSAAVYGNVEKTMTLGPGEEVTINVDERYKEIVTQAVLCCYPSEGYSGTPTCSQPYNLTA